jgi:hypothetical protein
MTTKGTEETEKAEERAGAGTIDPPPTSSEKETNILLLRFKSHVRTWWPQYAKAIDTSNFDFLIEDKPYELWIATFPLKEGSHGRY